MLALGLALAGCGDDDEEGSADGGGTEDTSAETTAGTEGTESTEPAPAGGGIVMAGFAFEPGELTVAAGATIPLTNDDDAPHTFTSDEGGFDVEVEGGGTGEATAPSEPGTYDFLCRLHPRMTGPLTVE